MRFGRFYIRGLIKNPVGVPRFLGLTRNCLDKMMLESDI